MGKGDNHELADLPPPVYMTPTKRNWNEQPDSSSFTLSLPPAPLARQQSTLKLTPRFQNPVAGPKDTHPCPSTITLVDSPTPITQSTHNNKTPSSKSWFKRHRRLLLWAVCTNIPFAIFFLIDIIGTQSPKSSLYRNVVYLGGKESGLPFNLVYVVLAMCTALVNVNLFSRYRKAVRLEKHPPNTQRRKTLHSIILWGCFMLMVPCLTLWPFAACKIHNIVKPVFPTCRERGFGSSVLLKATSALLLDGNTAIISSTDDSEMKFGLDLRARGEDIRTFTVTPRAKSISPRSLVPKVLDKSMTFHMATHSYDFSFTALSTNNSSHLSKYVKHGKFSDSPLSYLSFPTLSTQLRSSGKGNWSTVGDPGSPPSVEMVNPYPESTTLIKTVESEKGDEKCTHLRMCSAWTVEEMVGDVDIMESVFAVIGRVAVEMVKYGLSC